MGQSASDDIFVSGVKTKELSEDSQINFVE